jgi:hypothetical protein
LSWDQWLLIVISSVTILFAVEFDKFIRRRKLN